MREETDIETLVITASQGRDLCERILNELGADAPARVELTGCRDGEVVLRLVKSASEVEGMVSQGGNTPDDEPATEELLDKRKRDKEEREERFDHGE